MNEKTFNLSLNDEIRVTFTSNWYDAEDIQNAFNAASSYVEYFDLEEVI